MTKVELELLTDIDMVLLFEKGIRGGISRAIQRHASANNKYMPNCNSKVLSTYLICADANNLYGLAMSKKLPINNFKWCDALQMFTSDFIKNYDEDSDTGYLLEVDLIILKKYMNYIETYIFYLSKKENYLLLLKIKKRMLFTLQH